MVWAVFGCSMFAYGSRVGRRRQLAALEGPCPVEPVLGSNELPLTKEFWAASFEGPNSSRLTEDTGALDIIKCEMAISQH